MKNLIIWFIACFVLIMMVTCGHDDDNVKYEEEVIKNPVNAISINIDNEGIILSDVGETFMVSVTVTPTNADNRNRVHYTFVSGNTNVFTVDDLGNITATGPGEAILSVVANNYANVKATCKVIVTGKRVVSISVDEAYKELSLVCEPGVLSYGSFELFPRVTVEPSDASVRKVRFSSSDQNIAFVDGNGKIIAKGVGIATIRVEAIDGSGKYDECVVKVSEWRQDFLDRSDWKITSSPWVKFTPDGTEDEYGGPPENLIDDNSEDTRVGLLKATAVGGPGDGIIYFTVDLGSEQDFNYFYWEGGWTNGSGSVNNNVKVNRINYLYGSNESMDGPFTLLQSNITISTGVYNSTINLNASHKYRYVRVELRPYSTSIANNAIAVLWRDFKLGYRELLQP